MTRAIGADLVDGARIGAARGGHTPVTVGICGVSIADPVTRAGVALRAQGTEAAMAVGTSTEGVYSTGRTIGAGIAFVTELVGASVVPG